MSRFQAGIQVNNLEMSAYTAFFQIQQWVRFFRKTHKVLKIEKLTLGMSFDFDRQQVINVFKNKEFTNVGTEGEVNLK